MALVIVAVVVVVVVILIRRANNCCSNDVENANVFEGSFIRSIDTSKFLIVDDREQGGGDAGGSLSGDISQPPGKKGKRQASIRLCTFLNI